MSDQNMRSRIESSSCYVCGNEGVLNVVLLKKGSLIPEKGWGCFFCGVSGGAVAFVGEACIERGGEDCYDEA